MTELLSVLNEQPRLLAGPQLFHSLIDWEQHEGSCALDFLSEAGARQRYSYHELWKCTRSLAATLESRLRSKSVSTETQAIIPILLPQSPALYIAILAILNAGAAYCPITLDSPPDRIKFVVGDVSADIIITTKASEELATWPGGPEVIVIDDAPSVSSDEVTTDYTPTINPNDLAYVMYTSGSTGKPKGVLLSHLAVTQSLLAHDTLIPKFSRFLQFAAPSFDVSQFEIFFPLYRGATLVGCHRSGMLNDLCGIINKLEVDAAELTPTVAGALIQKRTNVPGLKVLLTIGEMLTRPVVDEFGGSETRESMLYGMYGPTEAAIHCTIHSTMQAGVKVANIGVPFETVSTFIVEMDSNHDSEVLSTAPVIVPRGQTGELVLGGPQLASGYLNRPEQNAAAFIHIQGNPAYRTGDKARILNDGTVEILGRISSGQVKIRGQRAELGEVEEAVYKHPDIKSAVASVVDGSLVVFVLTKGSGIQPSDIIDTCTNWLPKFMVPSDAVLLESFPYLSSGKVDKRRLEADLKARDHNELEKDPGAGTLAERTISGILHDQLNFLVRTSDRLAAQGLDSLMAIKVASTLRNSGFSISPLEVLQADTLKDLSEVCGRHRVQAPIALGQAERFENLEALLKSKMADEEISEIESALPCTSLQDAMLSETQLNPAAYNNEVVIKFLGSVALDTAIEAIDTLAKHNPILRTSFVNSPTTDSAFTQVVRRRLIKPMLTTRDEQATERSQIEKDFTAIISRPLRINIIEDTDNLSLHIHIHHALYDGWALELLLDDLEAILSCSQLPSRPSFQKIVEADLSVQHDLEAQSRKDYWKDHLALFDPQALPSFHSTKFISEGLRVSHLETSIATERIESLAREVGVSSQSFFQAAYAMLLSSYLGTKDVTFGTVFSGRTLPIDGIETIIGPCLSTLPVRVDLETMSTSSELVQQLHAITRKHLQYSSLPLRDIKKSANIDPGRAIFDTILVWQQTLHNADSQRSHIELVESKDYLEFNLTLEFTPGKDNIHIKANYQNSIFPSEQITLLLSQFEHIICRMLESLQDSLDDVATSMSNHCLSIDNPSPTTTISTSSLAECVEKIAAEEPNRPAIEFALMIEDEKASCHTMSYSQLNSRANEIAHYLCSIGARADDLVCVCLEKSPLLYATILAVIKTGAGYLPLTPDTPGERVRQILPDANIDIVVTESMVGERFTHLSKVKIVYVDELEYDDYSNENLNIKPAMDDIAYSIFTSGSTGVPKGVLVTQGNLLSNLEILAELYPHTTSSRLLQSCSQAFDVSVFEIFFTWYIGACLCSASKDVIFRDIEMAIRALRVTHLSLTPTVAALISPANVPSVTFLVTAGEAVTQKVFNLWAGHGLYQGYGPSETTNICTVRPNVEILHPINNIGQGFKNTSTFILAPSEDFRIVARGGIGEFCFGGAQVGRGYLKPDQMVGKFISHPQYGRLYRSGDFGRMLTDRSLHFTGRQDDQVKVRGFRIELGEINAAILSIPDVVDCTTLVIETNASQRLVSFWVPKNEPSNGFQAIDPTCHSTSFRVLFSTLSSTLPFYMVPSNLIPVSILPSTVQGKIDKRHLVKHYHELHAEYLSRTSQSLASSSDHSWTEIEEMIADAVAKAGQVSRKDIGPGTSFFSLGIDSISAINLSKQLRDQGFKVEISDVLKCPSVIRLAEAVVATNSQSTSLANSVSSESRDDWFDEGFVLSTRESFESNGLFVESILPCTPLQEAMLSSGDSSTPAAYINHTLLKLKISQEEFEYAWTQMIRRHEILRTCFLPTSNARFAFAQVILEQHTPSFQSYEAVDIYHTIREILSATDLDPMQQTQPHQVVFIKSKSQLHALLSMHHSIYDGYSLSVLFSEMEKLMKKEALPDAVSFAPFMRYSSSLDLDDADKFWDEQFSSFQPLRESQAPQASHYNKPYVENYSLVPELSWINAQSQLFETSLLSVCQTVWSSIVGAMLQSSDVCFGNIVSGRTIPVSEIDRLVAPCFNTVPVQAKGLNKLTFQEGFRAMHAQNAEILPYQLTPLRRIQAKYSPDGRPLFDTLLILQPPARELDSSVWSLEDDQGAMDLPIVIEILPRTATNSMELILHSYSSYLSKDEARAILHRFNELLTKALKNPRHQMLTPEVKAMISCKLKERGAVEAKPASNALGMDASTDSTEISVRDAFAQFSNVPINNIAANTTIFRLGLDSIHAVQIASLLRKQGYSLVAGDILQNPTVHQLATHLKQSKDDSEMDNPGFDFEAFDSQYLDAICAKFGVAAEDIEAIRPCTGVQSGMLAQTMHSNGIDYVNSFCMKLVPGTSLERLQTAWNTVAQRHELLRTAFASIDDVNYPFAMVSFAAQGEVVLPWFDAEDATLDVYLGQRAPDFSKGIEQWPWKLEVLRKEESDIIKFTGHHALYDAQSLELILSEVAEFYHDPIPADEEAPSFEHLMSAILQAGDAQHETIERQDFWSKENQVFINRFPDLTPLYEESVNSTVSTRICDATLITLEEHCREHETSLQAAGQAAWAKLLSIYTGEPITTFGVTLSGRSIVEGADEIAFPSIVTLPMSIDVSGTNKGLLRRSVNLSARLHKYQFSPLTTVQKLSGHPEGKMFDTLFTYQKTVSLGNGVERPWQIVEEEASVDYVVSIELDPQHDGTLKLRLTTKDRLVPQEQAVMILQQFDTILREILEIPESQTSSGTLNRSDIFSVTAAREPTLPSEVSLLHEFVSRQSRLTPDSVALEYVTQMSPIRSHSWSYAELNAQGNRVAHLLRNHGIGQGELVGICFEKCPEASFAILGILKAGCAYVAIDPNAPAERIKFILKDSESNLVLSAGKPALALKDIGLPKRIEIEDMSLPYILDEYPDHEIVLNRPINPQETSYCLYTSGTTGTPKGCLLSHENAVQAMLSFQHLYAETWNKNSRWLTVASWHFDVSVMEQYWSWSVGIQVVCAPRDLIFEDMSRAIRELQISHIDLTPSLARLVHPDDVPSLWNGVFVTGGEQLNQEILDIWGEKRCIYNGYGPTEATIGCTMFTKVPANGKPANIGVAYPNVGSYILKPGTNSLVFRGGVGELCISGKLVGKGYLNRPDKTEESFPYLEQFDERIYRTGDLVRILHDNTFLFLGRADDQVKLRGQRIQLSEGNEVMRKYVAELDQVSTLVLRHEKQQKEQLVTFFVPTARQSSPSNLIAPLRDACKAHLPPYMVPTHFIPLESLPLSGNNKADARQLARIYNDFSIEKLQQLSADGYASKVWSTVELEALKALAQIMKIEYELLTPGSTIFEFGVDSISVIGLCRALKKAGYQNAQLSVVMKNSSINNLIQVLTSEVRTNNESRSAYISAKQRIAAFTHKHKAVIAKELDIESEKIEAIAPCTASQEGMIFRFLDSDKDVYYNTFDLVLAKEVNVERLKSAWTKLVQDLQILRTKFVLTGDGCAQVVLTSGEIVQTAAAGKHSILASPWRVQFAESHGQTTMSLSMLHTLYDGMSLPLVLNSLKELYLDGRSINRGLNFHTVLPYGPLARVEGAEGFWIQALREAHYSPLPELCKLPAADVHAVRHVVHGAHVEALRQKLGVTHQALVQAVWASAIQEYVTARVSFGLVISGRSIDFDNADEVVGPLLNTVIFQINIEPGMSWVELVKSCHDFNTAMLPYQHTALKDIQKWCGAGLGESLFDTLFVFQREEEKLSEGLWKQCQSQPLADYPLAFEAQLNTDGSWTFTIIGQGIYVSNSMAEALLDYVERSLAALEHPEQLVPSTGKLGDKSNNPLRERQLPRSLSANTSEFEWTSEAQIIRDEVSSLSQTADVSEKISLFELGLDSIDVIRLSSRLKKQGIKLPVSTIIRCQTISQMSKELSRPISVINASSVSIAEYEKKLTEHLQSQGKMPSDALAILPATALQEGLVAEMIASDYTRYLNHEAYRIIDDVDFVRLKEAWKHVVEANSILRTSFVEVDAIDLPVTYAQIVHDTQFEWQSVMIEDASIPQVINAEIEKAIGAARNGQLLRLVELQGVNDKYFVLSISHALYDGVSLTALHQDVWNAYHQNDITRPDPRETLEDVLGQDGPDAVEFWKTSLSGLPSSRFPQQRSGSAEVHKWEQPSQYSLLSIQAFCRKHSISLQTLGQACWALLLANYQKSLDVVFGAVLSCRDTDEAHEIMFPLMNTVAVRSVIHGKLLEMLVYMQENGHAVRQYQHFPLRKAQALAEPREGALFDTLFVYQGQQRVSETTKSPLYEAVSSFSDVEFPVCVEMELVDGELLWRTSCKDSARSLQETMALTDDLDHILHEIMEHPEDPAIKYSDSKLSICGLSPFTDITASRSVSSRSATETSKSHKDSWTTTERSLRKVLSQVSQLPENTISKDQTIFHLGLDSISAIKVSSILRRQGVKLGVQDMMRHSTIRLMAESLTAETMAPAEIQDFDAILAQTMKGVNFDHAFSDKMLSAEEVEDIMPVTAGQLYMLSRWQVSGATAFTAAFHYEIRGSSKSHFESVWAALIKQHAILRTIFVKSQMSNLPFLQLVLKTKAIDVLWTAKNQAILDLQNPISLTAQEHDGVISIVIHIHHALYDAVSLYLLVQDLQLLLSSSAPNVSKSSWKQFIVRGLDRDATAHNKRQKFWQEYLNGSELMKILQSSKPTADHWVQVFQPAVRIGDIVPVAQKFGLSVDALLIAAFSRCYKKLMSSRTTSNFIDESDALFGLYLSNRAEFPSLTAPTLNLLPIRTSGVSLPLNIVAHKVQDDILAMSEPSIINTSLKEIHEWTHATINVFVNILKAVAEEDDEEEKEGLVNGDKLSSEISITTTLHDNGTRARRSILVDMKRNQGAANSSEKWMREAYLPSVDVEFKLLEDGTLDIGVFGPCNMISIEEARRMVNDLGIELRRLSDD